jgi:hypothetical protein
MRVFDPECLTGQSPTWEDKMQWLKYWKSGDLPSEIRYGSTDGETKDLKGTGAMTRIRKNYRTAECPASQDFSVGHFEAALETADDI